MAKLLGRIPIFFVLFLVKLKAQSLAHNAICIVWVNRYDNCEINKKFVRCDGIDIVFFNYCCVSTIFSEKNLKKKMQFANTDAYFRFYFVHSFIDC